MILRGNRNLIRSLKLRSLTLHDSSNATALRSSQTMHVNSDRTTKKSGSSSWRCVFRIWRTRCRQRLHL